MQCEFILADIKRKKNRNKKLKRNEKRYYWCDECKAYHLTSQDKREEDNTSPLDREMFLKSKKQ